MKRARSLCRRPAPPAPGTTPPPHRSFATPARRLTDRADRRLNAGVDVANPIYDVVFTYLMQNHRVARLLIGRITGLAVQSLTVSPQGTALRRTPEDPEHDLPLTLLRMTFAARVQTRDGSERQVLIEILKANSPTVIERFRRYLGQQIGSGENTPPPVRLAHSHLDCRAPR